MKCECGYKGPKWDYTATASIEGRMHINKKGDETTVGKTNVQDTWDTTWFCPECQSEIEE